MHPYHCVEASQLVTLNRHSAASFYLIDLQISDCTRCSLCSQATASTTSPVQYKFLAEQTADGITATLTSSPRHEVHLDILLVISGPFLTPGSGRGIWPRAGPRHLYLVPHLRTCDPRESPPVPATAGTGPMPGQVYVSGLHFLTFFGRTVANTIRPTFILCAACIIFFIKNTFYTVTTHMLWKISWSSLLEVWFVSWLLQ